MSRPTPKLKHRLEYAGVRAALAATLGLHYDTVPIEAGVAGVTEALKPVLAGTKPDTTEENLQARVRGTLLMALSNKFGWLLLTTGNKSEMATGYSTLYGDMAGGFALLKDVPKTMVYELARWRNAQSESPVIPVVSRHIISAGHERIGNLAPSSIHPFSLWNAEELFVRSAGS